jgi:hypothetical protein
MGRETAPQGRGADPARQTCTVCGVPYKFDFHVPDDVWAAVVPWLHRERVVCLDCFDEFAAERGIDYAASLRELCFAGRRAAFVFEARMASDV